MDTSPLFSAGSEDRGDRAARWAEVRTSRLGPWNPGTATPAPRLTYCRGSGRPAGPTETGRQRRSPGNWPRPRGGEQSAASQPLAQRRPGTYHRRRPGPGRAKGEESRFRDGLPGATTQTILRAHYCPEARTFLLRAISAECAGAAGAGRKRWGSRRLLRPKSLTSFPR